MKFRQIYTVIRPFEERNVKAAESSFDCVIDEAGEYLYGGNQTGETINVALQVQRESGRWQTIRKENDR